MRLVRRLLMWLLILAAVLAVAVVAIFQTPPFGGRASGARLQRMQASAAFVNGRFENTPPQQTDQSILRNLQLYRQGFVRSPSFEIPVVPLARASLEAALAPGLRAIWFGHASTLVEIDGVRVMTDPVLSDRVSPGPIGPTRFHPPPLPLGDLTNIDAVVISHDHYDHLDMPTVRQLAAGGTHFYVAWASAHTSSGGRCRRPRSTRWTGGTSSRSRACASPARRPAITRDGARWTTPRYGVRG